MRIKKSNSNDKYLGKLKITEKISELLLTLPIYPNMTKEEINYIVNTIDEFFEINKLDS
jgi:perosamine synthetase